MSSQDEAAHPDGVVAAARAWHEQRKRATEGPVNVTALARAEAALVEALSAHPRPTSDAAAVRAEIVAELRARARSEREGADSIRANASRNESPVMRIEAAARYASAVLAEAADRVEAAHPRPDDIRDRAVAAVDRRHGYALEHSPSPAAHRMAYDEEEERLRIEAAHPRPAEPSAELLRAVAEAVRDACAAHVVDACERRRKFCGKRGMDVRGMEANHLAVTCAVACGGRVKYRDDEDVPDGCQVFGPDLDAIIATVRAR